MTKPSMRCVRTWVVRILSGLPGRLDGADGEWLGPLTAAGNMGGGRGGGLLLLLLVVVVAVSWEGSSTCDDLITEWLDMMEDELVTAGQ